MRRPGTLCLDAALATPDGVTLHRAPEPAGIRLGDIRPGAATPRRHAAPDPIVLDRPALRPTLDADAPGDRWDPRACPGPDRGTHAAPDPSTVVLGLDPRTHAPIDRAATTESADTPARPAAVAPLRILIYGLNFAPELTGIGRYTGDMAAWLVEQGHAVEAVTAYPYYPHWKLSAGWPVRRWSRAVWKGVTVHRCPLWVPAVPTTRSRILHLLSFALSSAPVALWCAWRFRPDIVFVVEPTSLAAPVALLAARLARAQSWLHVQDIEMGAAERLGLLECAGRTGRLLASLYGRTLRAFDRVTTLSDRMRRKLTEYGRPEAAIGLFPNWVDTEKFKPVDATAMRAELGLKPTDICVLYAGNLGEKQGVEQLLDVASLLEDDPRIRLVICGAGCARPRIEAGAAGRPNIQLLDPQPDDRFVELLSAADIHVLPQKKGMTHYVMPSKLGPMLASARPIVAQAEEGCEVRRVLGSEAIALKPEDAGGMAAAVGRIISSPAGPLSSAQAARRAALSLSMGVVLAAAILPSSKGLAVPGRPGAGRKASRPSELAAGHASYRTSVGAGR